MIQQYLHAILLFIVGLCIQSRDKNSGKKPTPTLYSIDIFHKVSGTIKALRLDSNSFFEFYFISQHFTILWLVDFRCSVISVRHGFHFKISGDSGFIR